MLTLLTLLPSLGTLAAVVIVLLLVHRVLEGGSGAPPGARFRNQLLMLALTALGGLLVLLVLPLGDATRGQLLGLIGVVASAAIALSSTTFLGNAMAGVMLRSVRNFRAGDFIRAGDHFGRVSERGLFHVEIQTEDRDLTTLPNLFLVTHPVTTVRSSGTILSTTISLGYDVARTLVEDRLLHAARAATLRDPFVQILELGDFSVTYRVAGLFEDVKHLLSTRSLLRAQVLDSLHEADIEIVSPTFMNTRALQDARRFIPAAPARPQAAPTTSPEAIVFDKAEEAASLEALHAEHATVCKEIADAEDRIKKLSGAPKRARVDAELRALEQRKARLEKLIAKARPPAAEGDR